jgi:uncharacterized OsmC-like protein
MGTPTGSHDRQAALEETANVELGDLMSLNSVIDVTKSAVTDDPKNAAAHFTVEHRLDRQPADKPTLVHVKARGHEFSVDEPPTLGGADSAANPVEYALAALGSCQVITYQFWAAKLGITLDSINVTVDGDLDLHGFFGFDNEVRPGFRGVHVSVDLTGPDRGRFEELQIAVDQHCPVLDLFSNPTPVQTALK